MNRETLIRTPRTRRVGARGGLWLLMLFPELSIAGDPWSASVALTSNYVYRGISQTDGAAALQIGGNYRSPLGWFAGAWGSNVDPYPGGDASKELGLYAGMYRALGSEFNFQATFAHYGYLQDPRPGRFAYDDLSVTIGYQDLMALHISYEPNSSAYTDLGAAYRRTTLAYELTGQWPLGRGFVVNAGAGFYDLEDLFGVSYWAGDVGIRYAYRHLTLDVRRFYCSAAASELYGDASAKDAWAVTALWRF